MLIGIWRSMISKLKSKFKSEDNKRLLSNFISLSVLQGANYILPLITLPYLVRVLGVEYFGLLAFAGATIAYFNIITDYGFNLTATREISIHREDKEKVIEIFSSVMTIKVILMFVSLFLLTVLVFSFEKFSAHALVYFLTFGTVVGQVLFPVWFFQGMERMKYITYLNILSKIIFTVAIFIFVQEQSDYWIVPLLTSVGFLVAGIWSLVLIKKEFDVSFQLQTKKTLLYHLKEGWHVFVAGFAGNFYRNFNVLVLGFLTNNLYVGYYSIAEKVVKILQTLQNIVGNVLFPYISNHLKTDKRYFMKFDAKYKKYILSTYSVGVILLFVLAPYIVYILNGSFSKEITLNLQIMSVVLLMGGLNYYYGILGLISMNYKKDFSKYILITGFANIILAFVMVDLWKDVGASLALVLSESILLIMILKKFKNLKNYKNDKKFNKGV